MASAFTHAVVAAALSTCAPRGVVGPRTVALLCVLSVAPDLDVVAFGLGIPYEHPLGHRGLSHSLAFALLLAIPFARYGAGVRPLGVRLRLAGVAFACVASHGVLDAITNGGHGVGFWLPFDDTRHFFDWRPLPVSPIGVEAFFGPRGLRILRAEIGWIWVPAGLFAAAMLYIRRRSPAPGSR